MVEKTVVITNQSGLQARPAALFVQAAGKFTSNIWIEKDERKVNAKSILGLMSLAVLRGSRITIIAEGEDEQLAVSELEELITSGLQE